MKKINIVFAVLLFWVVTFSAKAQWSLNGNTGTSSSNFIGTKDAQALRFRTNNIERMYIRSDGGVGINDPGITPNNSAPILLYFQKASPGSAIQAGITSSTNGSSAIHVVTQGTGRAIYAIGSQWGSIGIHGDNVSGYGVQATSTYNYGLYASSTYGYYAAYFNKSIYTNGGYYSSSDQKLKQNIADFTSAMGIIYQLHPKKYHYRQDGAYKLMKLPEGEQVGLLAQEVEKVLPGLVKNTKFETALETAPTHTDASGKVEPQPDVKSETIEFKAVNYVGLIPVLIKGMQEQQAQIQQQQEKINSQDKKIEKLTALVDQLSSARQLPGTTGSAKNSEVAGLALLNQNAPNPFNQTTTIGYYVPQQASHVAIKITGVNGEAIKTYTISDRGNGELIIEAGKLMPGIYHYSLVIENQVVDTKKMIIIQ